VARRCNQTLLVVIAALVGLLPAPATASDTIGVVMGYGFIGQKRMGVESEGHHLSIGIHSPPPMAGDGLFVMVTLDLVIDRKYEDLTRLALSWSGAWAFGSDSLFGYLGPCFRTGVDGYPKPTFSPLDVGVVGGFALFFGPIGMGGEARVWLGWNIYEDYENEIEPHYDARVFVSYAF